MGGSVWGGLYNFKSSSFLSNGHGGGYDYVYSEDVFYKRAFIKKDGAKRE
jgi:hypothetical protein